MLNVTFAYSWSTGFESYTGEFLGSDLPCFLQLSHMEVRTLRQTRFSHRMGGKRPCAIRRAQLMQRREYYKTNRAQWEYIIVTSV